MSTDNRITNEMIIAIHEDLIRTGGRVQGILCDGTIDYILNQIDMQSGIHARVAWVLYMSRLHPFFDGNKRTSFIVAATILRLNGFFLTSPTRMRYFMY
ncbi:MAG: Fic family protein [Methanotrichaceae archaeon]|nr:Fic family protein [Methanotrichaceae archaeon]